MVATLEKKGTDYYLRLNRETVDRLGLSVGQTVDVSDDGRLQVRGGPLTPERRAELQGHVEAMDRQFGQMMRNLAK